MNAVDKLIAEGNALTRSLAIVEDGGETTEARRLCQIYLLVHSVDTLEDCTIDCALRKICRLEPVAYSIPPQEINEALGAQLFRLGACTWMQWARGDSPVGMLAPDERRMHPTEVVHSALDVMALTAWVEAVENLQNGDLSTGRRYFRRATVLGGEYGTVSNPVIQWTYAASFFPTAW